MEKKEINKSRRSFFLKGSAALGAGLVSAGAGAATLFDSSQNRQQMSQLQQKLSNLEDKEVLEHLHLAFTTMLENRTFDEVTDLFTEDAVVALSGIKLTGKAAVKKLFMEEYRNREISCLHTAHRRDQSQNQNLISVSDDRKRASASFYNQVLICTPVRWQSALAEMARQQGMTTQSYWENGRYDMAFTRVRDQWQISRLSYQKV